MLLKVYGDNALLDESCREWFRRFKNGNFIVEDKPRCGQPKNFEDKELEALLDENPTQTQDELVNTLGVTQKSVSVQLKSMEMIQKQDNWVPYELKSRNANFAACQQSVQCCKIGENLLGSAEMGDITSPAILSRRYSFRLPFVSIDGTRLGSSAFPLLWRSQIMDRFVDCLKLRIIFSIF